MKKFFLLVLLISVSNVLFSQDSAKYWKREGMIGINFSQVGLKNWAGGGDNTISIVGNFTYNANYLKKRIQFDNSIILAYGESKIGSETFRKSDDKIILISKLGYILTGAGERTDVKYNEKGEPVKAEFKKASRYPMLSVSGLLDFRTQFARGFDYKNADILGNPVFISNFMSPGYLTISGGADYKPYEFISFFVSPVSGRLTFVTDKSLSDLGVFGVDPGKNLKTQFGAALSSFFSKELVKNVLFQSRVSLFGEYKSPFYVVVNSENLLFLKVNDFINASVGLDIVYDHNVEIVRDDGTVGPSTQLRNTIAVGFGFNF